MKFQKVYNQILYFYSEVKSEYSTMKKLNPPKVVLLSYLIIILIGAILLFLPVARTKDIAFIDALFTSTSAVTVTGLIVLDTERDFTLFGQIVIMLLIQIGGLGYMTLMTFFLITFGKKNTSIKGQMVLAEALNSPGLGGIFLFLKRVIIIVLGIESLGVFLLFLVFSQKYSVLRSLWYSVFHCVAAFNNAGFSVFSDNLIKYRSNLPLNLIIAGLIIFGGIGYYVIIDVYLYLKGKNNRISTHTKIVCISTLILIVGGTLGILLSEFHHTRGLWAFDWYDRVLVAFFTSVSARTAGFNTVDIGTFSPATLFIIVILMFIGASPGGTGGGIKTVTASVIYLAIINHLKGYSKTVVFKKTVDNQTIYRAMIILSLAFTFVSIITLMIIRLEDKTFISALFEIVSAFATVGLSVGTKAGLSLASNFSIFSKSLVILTMIVGKVGILSFAVAISRRERDRRVNYPDARLLI